MNTENNKASRQNPIQQDSPSASENSSSLPRRAFFSRLSLAATGAAVALAPAALGAPQSNERWPVPWPPEHGGSGLQGRRIAEALRLRLGMAEQDARLGPGVAVSNGDEALYSDRGATYTKALPHDSYGRVDPAAFSSLVAALRSCRPSEFQRIQMGGTRTLTDPQGGLCYDLEMMDSAQFGQPQVPPAPKAASEETATELVEHFWASLLRDVPYTEFSSNAVAAQAAAEIGSSPAYRGPRDNSGRVTPETLFRGAFPGESLGPYVSQFMLLPAFFGSIPLTQQQSTYMPGIDYATDFGSWLDIQNGVDTGQRNQMDPQYRYIRNGRDLTSFTHMDVLFQAYLMAFLVLNTINANAPGAFSTGGAPLNPGNPYHGSRTQSGFGTFGGPDIASTIEEVAVKAVNAVWFQKWYVHMRARPESFGGIVHLLKTGQENRTDVRLSNFLLNSQALEQSYKKHGTYLLSQTYPEGSPTHPSYPTGHGTVAGACITVLKFFYDGNFVIPNPVVASADGLSLLPYTGADAGQITVNSELNKLGHNVSFGHGIHAGIHFRSDTDASLLLGEAVALAFLRNRARTYNEPFSVSLTKFDGATVTISNP
ncbi:MAG: vanadium-dependent haloperoxidase [Acidobacteriaceae bacterium]|nr:vanadium-dependent haloperoxidase [Acidobacteriaceae bacterium]